MGLMFFGGVMSLFWIAGLAVLVLLEKTAPAGHWLGYATGVALLVLGAGMLALASLEGHSGITRSVGARESSSIVE